MSESLIGRVPPHSVDAEEYLISCCFLDGREIITRCKVAGVTQASFYSPALRVIFDHLVGLYDKGLPIDLQILAEDLKTSRELDQIGGYAYLTQVSSRIPTTAQSNFFIEKVRELELLREVIKIGTYAVEETYSYSGGLEEHLSQIEFRLSAIRSGSVIGKGDGCRSIADFAMPPDNDPGTLIGDRYVCRGHARMTVGGSGMGKSCLAYQESICYALGRPFMGMKPARPLTSIHFQSEDEDGDIAEVFASVVYMMKLTEAEMAQVAERVIIKTEKVLRGPKWISDMRMIAMKRKADLVWINPLHAFMEGDIKDAESVGRFCREGLNGANKDSLWAYMIVHHTPKPAAPKGQSDPKEREWNEIMYEGAGSADLVNFCRAVQILKATKAEGEFNLYLAKRGKRANVFIEKTSEESGQMRLELTTKVAMMHSKAKMVVKGRTKELGVMFWEIRDQDKPADKKGGKRDKAGRKAEFNIGGTCYFFPASTAEAEGFTSISKHAQNTSGISRATFYRHKDELYDGGYVTMTEDGGWRRTKKGDEAAYEFLKSRP